MSVLQSIVAFLVTLGILVTIHEYGHFWVARRLGVKILRFSVGFGRPLWMRRFGPDRTEFVFAALPLGGYVKMLDEREGEVPAAELQRAFNRRPVGARIAIVVAGPAANFALAVLAYWLMFMVGVSGLAPVLGEVSPGSAAARAGLQAGERIVAVDGRSTPTWEAVLQASLKRILEPGQMNLRVTDRYGGERAVALDLGNVAIDDLTRGNFFDVVGMEPVRPVLAPVIGDLVPGGRAQEAGLQPGDRVLSADGRPVGDWAEWVQFIRARPGQPIDITVERDGRRLDLRLVPDSVREDDGATVGRIGAMVSGERLGPAPELALERYGPITAAGRAVGRTWDMSVLTLGILGKMLFGEASVQNLSGPISIAQYAGQSASIGIAAFLSFLAVVSLSLGILNLLPVPLLDGGHLMYYLIELVTRRPVSESAQAFGQQIGFVLLLGLMGLAFYNDLVRIL